MYPHVSYLHTTKVPLYLSSIGNSRKLFSCCYTIHAIVTMYDMNQYMEYYNKYDQPNEKSTENYKYL